MNIGMPVAARARPNGTLRATVEVPVVGEDIAFPSKNVRAD